VVSVPTAGHQQFEVERKYGVSLEAALPPLPGHLLVRSEELLAVYWDTPELTLRRPAAPRACDDCGVGTLVLCAS